VANSVAANAASAVRVVPAVVKARAVHLSHMAIRATLRASPPITRTVAASILMATSRVVRDRAARVPAVVRVVVPAVARVLVPAAAQVETGPAAIARAAVRDRAVRVPVVRAVVDVLVEAVTPAVDR